MPVLIKKNPKAELPDLPELEKRVFQCMLAASAIPKHEEIKLPIMWSDKLDGLRSPLVAGEAKSRKMILLPNRFYQSWVQENAHALHGFDGEVIVGPPNLESTYHTTESGIMSAGGEPDFKFYLFEHWGLAHLPAWERYERLCDIYASLPYHLQKRVVLVKQNLAHTIEQLSEGFTEAIEGGYEGLILKGPTLPYHFGRSTIKQGYALKWKEFVDIDCQVLDILPGHTNTNKQERDELGKAKRSSAKAGKVAIESVGRFVVLCVDENSPFLGKTFKAGTGSLTDPELAYIWKNRQKHLRRFMKVKIGKAGAKNLPRFPNFNGWRDAMDL